MLRRPLAALLAALVACFCAGSVQRSAATKLGDPSFGVDAGPLVVGHVTRPDAVARPHATRAADGVSGGWLLASAPTVSPPSVTTVERAAGHPDGAADSGFTERGARGPPGDLS